MVLYYNIIIMLLWPVERPFRRDRVVELLTRLYLVVSEGKFTTATTVRVKTTVHINARRTISEWQTRYIITILLFIFYTYTYIHNSTIAEVDNIISTILLLLLIIIIIIKLNDFLSSIYTRNRQFLNFATFRPK